MAARRRDTAQDIDLTKPVLTVAEYAVLFRIPERTAYDRVKNGDIPAIRVGRAWRIPTANVVALLGLTP